MKKFLILLLAIFTCFNAEATIHMAHSSLPAKIAAANAARRQRERRKQHEKDFHHGNLVYVVQYVKEFTFKDNVYTVETYEIQNYYYEIDPDKCTIKKERVLKDYRPATEQEIKERQKMIDFIFVLVSTTLAITLISIILIVLSGKKKLSIGYHEI